MNRRPKHDLYGSQIRAARALLGISASQLAEMTDLGVNTIRRAEREDGLAPVTTANALRIAEGLERAGLLLLNADGEGPGVRFALPQGEGCGQVAQAAHPDRRGFHRRQIRTLLDLKHSN